MEALIDAGARNFHLSDTDFSVIRATIHRHSGIELSEHKRELVYSRLTRRLREHGLSTFKSYIDLLGGPKGSVELEHMINALTTNLTSFFREKHHFDHLQNNVLPAILGDRAGSDRRLRIWSSACSTGEEPYSIAATLLESPFDWDRIDARILATDLNTDVLKQAAKGHYASAEMVKSPDMCRKYFEQGADGHVEAAPIIKNLISFKQLNLLSQWPMKGRFDAIFCRNVLIYFDTETKNKLVDRFVDILSPRGWLYLGHSESASGNHPGLELIGQTTYRKI